MNYATAAFTPVQDVFNQKLHMVAVTTDELNDRRLLYLDGQLAGTNTDPFTNASSTGNFGIGGKLDGQRIAGITVPQFLAYDRILSAADILSIWNNPTQMINNAPAGRTFAIGTAISKINRQAANLPLVRQKSTLPVLMR